MAKRLKITESEISATIKEFIQAIRNGVDKGKVEFKKTFGETKTRAKVMLSEVAKQKIEALVKAFPCEVGFYGLAERVPSDVEDLLAYRVYDILVPPPQTVSAAKVDSTTEQMTEWFASLPDEQFNNLRFHGHSHVNMGVSPSPTDTAFYEESAELLMDDYDVSFQIFSIWNKSGSFYFCIYDKGEGLFFDKKDISVFIESGPISEFVQAAKEVVEERKPQSTNVTYIMPLGGSKGTAFGTSGTQPKAAATNTPVITNDGGEKKKRWFESTEEESPFYVQVFGKSGICVDDFYAKPNSTLSGILYGLDRRPAENVVTIYTDVTSVSRTVSTDEMYKQLSNIVKEPPFSEYTIEIHFKSEGTKEDINYADFGIEY